MYPFKRVSQVSFLFKEQPDLLAAQNDLQSHLFYEIVQYNSRPQFSGQGTLAPSRAHNFTVSLSYPIIITHGHKVPF